MAGRRIRPRACILDIEATALDADIGHLVGAGIMVLTYGLREEVLHTVRIIQSGEFGS